MTNFVPMGDRIIVERLDEAEKTKGGIIIPDTAKEKPMRGKILAVGPGKRNDDGQLIPMDLKVGDTVLFGKWSGTEVRDNDVDFLIMNQSDVLAIVR